MNKILKIFLIFFLCISCTSEDEGSNVSADDVLLRKIITTFNGNTIYSNTHETKYNYDGKKLINFESPGRRGEFTYSDDKITNFKRYVRDAGTPSSIFYLYTEVNFYYDSQDRLIKFEVYSYNGDVSLELQYLCTLEYQNTNSNIINFKHHYIPDFPELVDLEGYFIVENNEIIERWRFDPFSNSFSLMNEYTYDNKNHPLKNVIGLDKIAPFSMFFENVHNSGFSTNYGTFSNCIKISYLGVEGVFTEYPPHTYEYNSKGFPISIDKDNESLSDELFYN